MAAPLLSLGRFLPEAALAAGAAARFSTAGGVAAYKLPELPYAYGALEPVISGQIMELHYSKHHAGYVANLNKALEEYADAEAKGNLQKMITLQSAINFNGGGARAAGGAGAVPVVPPVAARPRRRGLRARAGACSGCDLTLHHPARVSRPLVAPRPQPPLANARTAAYFPFIVPRPHQPRHLLDQPGARKGLPPAQRRAAARYRGQVGQPRQVHSHLQRADRCGAGAAQPR